MAEGYMMSLRTAMVLMRYFRRYKVSGREEREAVVARLARKMKAMHLQDVESMAKSLRDKRN